MSNKVRYEGERKVRANGIEIAYDIFGDPGDPPLFLIMGYSMQMVAWEERFCAGLARKRRRVIRFDNRDIGHSTWLKEKGTPNIKELMTALLQGKSVAVPYTLSDMAADVIGLMDVLEIGTAHIMGMSMGGMIAQTMAIEHPARIRSLISLASTYWTMDANLPRPTPEAAAVLMKPIRADREGFIEDSIQAWKVIGGIYMPMDEDMLRERARRFFARGVNLSGLARQMAAIIGSGSRRDRLHLVSAPTLVIHGEADPLFPAAHGFATAEAIAGSRLQIIKGMGHEVPPAAWAEIIDFIILHTEFY